MWFLGKAWAFVTSAVSEVSNWVARHPIENVLYAVASVAIGKVTGLGVGMVAGLGVGTVAALAVGVVAAVGFTRLGVRNNKNENRLKETDVHNAALRRELTDLLIQQQEQNTITQQQRVALVKNVETINKQIGQITDLQAKKIEKQEVDLNVKTTSNVEAKVSEIGMYSRTEVRKRTVGQCESKDLTNVNNFASKI